MPGEGGVQGQKKGENRKACIEVWWRTLTRKPPSICRRSGQSSLGRSELPSPVAVLSQCDCRSGTSEMKEMLTHTGFRMGPERELLLFCLQRVFLSEVASHWCLPGACQVTRALMSSQIVLQSRGCCRSLWELIALLSGNLRAPTLLRVVINIMMLYVSHPFIPL